MPSLHSQWFLQETAYNKTKKTSTPLKKLKAQKTFTPRKLAIPVLKNMFSVETFLAAQSM